MDRNLTAMERAFQLATSGNCETVTDIKKSLKREGFSVDQIAGSSLSKQLIALITKSRTNSNT